MPENKPTFEEWYATVPEGKNDTASYSLREAYNNLPYETMKQFAESSAHLPDTYKKPSHPTFSEESNFSNNDTTGGRWSYEDGKEVFTPSPFNIQQMGGVENYQAWMQRNEPGVRLNIPKLSDPNTWLAMRPKAKKGMSGVNNKEIEAEGGELIIENEYGDNVIVPRKDRKRVQQMINKRQFSEVDKLVSKYPKYADYAKDGSVYPKDPPNNSNAINITMDSIISDNAPKTDMATRNTNIPISVYGIESDIEEAKADLEWERNREEAMKNFDREEAQKRLDNVETSGSIISTRPKETLDASSDNAFHRATPNQQFMFPNLTGEAQKKAVDYHNAWIEAVAPLPSIGKAKNIANVTSKVDDAIIAGKKIVNEIPKNSKKVFKSEIDWNKWNKEIPVNKELMDEYIDIERKSKEAGTWMKDIDGSDFKGTPEQFVQFRSKNFKNFFENVLKDESGNARKFYHGSPTKGIQEFNINKAERLTSGDKYPDLIFSTDNKDVANIYSGTDGEVLEFMINSQNPKSINYNKRAWDGSGKMVYDIISDPNLQGMRFGPGPNFSPVSFNSREAAEKALKEKYKDFDYFDNLVIEEGNKFNLNQFESPVTTNKLATRVKDRGATSFEAENVIDVFELPKDFTIDKYLSNVVTFFNSGQAKSLKYNNGMFDINNPNIYKSIFGGMLGSTVLNDIE